MSIKEIQQEEEAHQQEVEFLKWWAAEEEKLRNEQRILGTAATKGTEGDSRPAERGKKGRGAARGAGSGERARGRRRGRGRTAPGIEHDRAPVREGTPS